MDYNNSWANICDKGFQGVHEVLRSVHPKKAPSRGQLSVDDIPKNKLISTGRVIVENWFDRQCMLWAVFSSKYKWKEDLYDHIFKLCFHLQNFRFDVTHFVRQMVRSTEPTKFACAKLVRKAYTEGVWCNRNAVPNVVVVSTVLCAARSQRIQKLRPRMRIDVCSLCHSTIL